MKFRILFDKDCFNRDAIYVLLSRYDGIFHMVAGQIDLFVVNMLLHYKKFHKRINLKHY